MDRDPPAPRGSGLAGSLRNLGASVLALIRTRVELVATELAEEKERRKEMLVLAVTAALFLALGLLLVAFLVVVLFWDSYRLIAICGVTLLYLGIGAWALLTLRRKVRENPPPFAATLAEFDQDMELLRRWRE
jgi:uncharacterized membrane protein YqjE